MKNLSEDTGKVPFGSVMNDFFKGDFSIWRKVLGGAVSVPILLAIMSFKEKGAFQEFINNPDAVIIIVSAILFGVFLGTSLGLKDIVEGRMDSGIPVSLPFKLLFGYGLVSVFVVWIPMIVFFSIFIVFNSFP